MIITTITITRDGGDTVRRPGMMVQERICGNGYKEKKHDHFVLQFMARLLSN